MDAKVLRKLSSMKKLLEENHIHYPLILTFFLILPFSLALFSPIASTEPILLDNEMMFEKIVNTNLASPGDKLEFTITYSNPMSETAYNVTIFEWMPTGLTLISSKPFYDGASDPETGFYRWSRGNVPPGQGGIVVVRALVNNVPVGTVITNTAHLTYENGTRVEVTSSVDITVTQAAGVEVYPDQIHSVAPHTDAVTEYNVTMKNTGNGLDMFSISLLSVAYNPSGANHEWKIELYDSTGYSQKKPVATVYDDNLENRSSWTDHGVVTNVTLASEESTWYVIKVIEAEGTSGSGNAYLDVHLIATSLFDPNVSSYADEMTIVKSVAGITLAPDYLRHANPGESMVYRHIVVNSGQTEVIDLNYTSPCGWDYSFWFDNGTALMDTDGSGCVDIGVLPKNAYTYVVVKMTVPYSTAAGINDTASITARGVISGNTDTVNEITVVQSAPVLGVDKKLVSENPRYQGDVVTYTISIANLGNTKLTRIPLDDAFETSSLDFCSADPAEDEYDETAGTIRWENLSALEPGQSILVTVSFTATEGDYTVRQSANVIDAEDELGSLISAIDMNKELEIIGTYSLTVTSAPNETLGGSFKANWIEHGIQKEDEFTTPRSIKCDQDTTVTVSHPQSHINKGNVRYLFNNYLPSASVTMDSDKTITLGYLTEYVLTFEQIGSGEPVYVTVDGTQLPEPLPQSIWVSKGSTIMFSYPSVVTANAGTTRYVLTDVSGNTTDASVTVNGPTNVTGSYKTQYYLDVTTEPEGLDTPRFSGWYDSSAYANIEVETLTGGDSVSNRYRFDHWTGKDIASTSSPSTEILMDAPKTATAYFVKQYYITVISLHGSSTASQWVDIGDSLTASVISPTEIVAGQTQWKCVGFSMDDEIKLGTSYTFEDIQDPHVIEFYWVQQFWLQVDTAVSEAAVEGTGWYDIGTLAPISAITTYVPSPAHRFVFASWTSAGSNEAPITDPASSGTTVTMNNYYTVKADWQEQWYINVISLHDDPTPSQWVNTADSLAVSVTSPADNDGAGTRYRCIGYKIDDGDLFESTSYTFINVQAAHTIEFEWTAQFYLTMSTNLGLVSPDSGWYDSGSIVSIEAAAPVFTEGRGYVWHGWTGKGKGSYSGTENPATVTVESAISETAYWKIDPLITIMISNDTIARGDRILVQGQTQPIQADVEISVIYVLPNGTRIEQVVHTDDDGYYQDTLFIDQDYLYNLFVDEGTWIITASRPSDISHENAQASTTLKTEARSVSQIHPILMAGAIVAVGLFVYAPPLKKLRNNNSWRRFSLALSLAGLVLGAVSLGLNWVSVSGTATTLNAAFDVDIFLYPFSSGSVLINNGLQYKGADISSLVHPNLQSVRGSPGPVLTMYLIPVGCALALTGLYKPKNARKRNFKATILVLSGLLIVTAAVHTFMFVQSQAGTIDGASIWYGAGVYIAVISGALTVLSGLFATRENHNKSHNAKVH